MDNPIYLRLKEKAARAALKIGLPSFYAIHKKEIGIAMSNFSDNRLIHKCRSYLDESTLHPAHGIQHCEKVALEAGAILQIESSSNNLSEADTNDLMICVQIAGLLHDIKRNEKDHTISGSKEAERILRDFNIGDAHKRYIVAAIRNHEAFKEVLDSEDESAKLVSDSLYDADKFRWGPDNFTTTLWLIMESTETSAEILYSDFQKKMDGIKRIKHTFRTETGKKYGPEFIDYGIEIGNEIFREMENIIGV
ncbi:MAG: hypothetical protein AB1632_11435 [Nitrospirota bacterium]